MLKNCKHSDILHKHLFLKIFIFPFLSSSLGYGLEPELGCGPGRGLVQWEREPALGYSCTRQAGVWRRPDVKPGSHGGIQLPGKGSGSHTLLAGQSHLKGPEVRHTPAKGLPGLPKRRSGVGRSGALQVPRQASPQHIKMLVCEWQTRNLMLRLWGPGHLHPQCTTELPET